MQGGGRVGILTQGCLSPEPRFTLPPWRGWERGSVLGAGASRVGRLLPGEQLLLSRQQERSSRYLSPVRCPLSVPVLTSSKLPWPRSSA